MREEFMQLKPASLLLEIAQDHIEVAGIFPEQLPAWPAGGRRLVTLCHDGDAGELVSTFGECLEKGDSLSTDRQAIRSVFDVAAGKDSAILAQQCRPDGKPRILAAGMLTGLAGVFKQVFYCHHMA